jgi:hypothetical protein
MTALLLDYAESSSLKVDPNSTSLGLAVNLRRPVRLHGRVKKNVLSLRLALQCLGEVVWSNDTWLSSEEYFAPILDPIITVHPDRVFFEAFSQDQSAYGLVIADRDLFEPEGDVHCGTTNVDFTSWLWNALGEMRTSRETWFRVGPSGFTVKTEGGHGRFERKVDVPDTWVRGFLALQAGMAMPGTRLQARPVDLLSVIHFMTNNRATTPPRALRYEFEPGQPAKIVLEPWEQSFTLKESQHNYQEKRTIRTWGRRRLKLLERILPYAESVTVYLKGRAMPTFYAVKLPGITYLLGLSGWTGNLWTNTGGYASLTDDEGVTDALVHRAFEEMRAKSAVSVEDLAKKFRMPLEKASAALVRLCRQGRAIFDVERRDYRHRELFEEPADEAKYFPPDPRKEAARKLIADGEVHVASCSPEETRKVRTLTTPLGMENREVVYRNWRVKGRVAKEKGVEVVVNDMGRIIFGTCTCAFFKENLLNQGACEHIQALFLASAAQRKDLPTSTVTDAAPTPSTPRAGGGFPGGYGGEGDEDSGGEDFGEEEAADFDSEEDEG